MREGFQYSSSFHGGRSLSKCVPRAYRSRGPQNEGKCEDTLPTRQICAGRECETVSGVYVSREARKREGANEEAGWQKSRLY